MSMQLLVDMNLSPEWVAELTGQGWTAIHWSTVGDPRADDQVVMEWARINRHVVLTHDLDFGTILALTHAAGPSVIQVRTQDPLPQRIGPMLFATLRQHEAVLTAGALVVVEEMRSRVRLLPI
jgi:predicted nuclease of predicted toxin-antitoxin system